MRLEINGIEADLGGNKIAISRKTIDIDNPFDRFVDITNQFILPFSQVNNDIFDSGKAVGSTNLSFEKLYTAKVIDQFFLFNGIGYLNSITPQGYKFQILEKGKSLFNALKTKLNTVNWDDKDILLTEADLNTLSTKDIDNCWVWPVICNHRKKIQANTALTTGDNRVKFSRPSFYLPALLKRIIEQNEYTWNYSSDELSQYLAFSSNHEDFLFTSYQKTIDETFIVSTQEQIDDLTTNDFAHADITVTATKIDIGTSTTRFRFRGNITSDGIYKLVIEATDKVSADVERQEFYIDSETTYIDFTTNDFQSDDGIEVEFFIEGTGTIEFDNVLLYSLLSENEVEDFTTNPFLGYKIKAYDNLPDIEYTTLYKTICVLTNSIPIINSFDKTITFMSLSDMQKFNSLDWSEKFIRQTEDITGTYENLAKTNYLKYNNDQTVDRTLGRSEFQVNSDILADETDYIEMNFGASYEVSIASSLIADLEVYEDTGRIPDKTWNIRLFYLNGTSPILGQFSQISWSILKENYYKKWFDSLYRIRIINCEMNLNKLDVLGWDLLQVIYIDYFKSYFIIISINKFIPGQTVNVEFLKFL